MSATFRLSVIGAPDGDASSDWTVIDADVAPADAKAEPDVILTISQKDLDRLTSGDLKPTVAYMQGLLKSTGDTGVLIDVLSSGASNWYR